MTAQMTRAAAKLPISGDGVIFALRAAIMLNVALGGAAFTDTPIRQWASTLEPTHWVTALIVIAEIASTALAYLAGAKRPRV